MFHFKQRTMVVFTFTDCNILPTIGKGTPKPQIYGNLLILGDRALDYFQR